MVSFVTCAHNEAARIDSQNELAMLQGALPVCDKKGGPANHQPFHGFNTCSLGLYIDRAGRLIEDQNRCVLEKRAGKSNPLAFAAGETHAPLAHKRFVPVRKSQDELMSIGSLGRSYDLRFAGARFRVRDVFGNAN